MYLFLIKETDETGPSQKVGVVAKRDSRIVPWKTFVARMRACTRHQKASNS